MLGYPSPMKTSVATTAACLFLVFFFTSFDATAQVIKGKLGYVIDGDSFYMVQDNGRRIRIRISGIDSPENEQAYGKEATAFLTDLMKDKELVVTPDAADRQGRTVAHVTVEGKDVAAEMIRNGYSWHYKKYSTDQELAKLETEAKAKKLALWKDSAPVAPWTYRGQQEKKATN